MTDGIAELLGAAPEEIIYTAGASESNNLAPKGIVQASRHVGKHIISTALEHSSVGGALSALPQQGCEVDLVDIRRDGTIDLEHLRELLRKDTVLVAICAVDSELGTVQPIQEIADILRDLSQLPPPCGRDAGRGEDQAGALRCGHNEHRAAQVLRPERQRPSGQK